MTKVRLGIGIAQSDGSLKLVTGRILLRPFLRQRTASGDVALPAPFKVDLDGLTAPEVDLDPAWFWYGKEEVSRGIERVVAVPDTTDTVNWSDLVDIDPDTLDPSASPEAAWWHEIELLKTLPTIPDDGALATLVEDPVSEVHASLSSIYGGMEVDYADLLSKHSDTNRLQIKLGSAGGMGATFEVTCFGPTHHVTSTINSASYDAYRRIWETWAGAASPVYASVSAQRYGELTVTGTFSAAADTAVYTTQIGAKFEATVAVPVGGAVALRTYRDNRGGVWDLVLSSAISSAGSRMASVSTWRSVATGITEVVFSDVPAGVYVLTGTFAGADPLNSPSGGTARGWLGFNYSSGTEPNGFHVHVQVPDGATTSRDTLLSPVSNWDIALNISPTEAGSPEWVPEHAATKPSVEVEPMRLFAGGAPLDLTNLPNGAVVQVRDYLDLSQHVYFRHSDTGPENLIEAWVTQRFFPDGRVTITGRWEALTDFWAHKGYVLMLPASSDTFDLIVSSRGEAATNTVADYGTRRYVDPDSGSWVALSSNFDYATAVTYDNRPETLRIGGDGKPERAKSAFIDSDAIKAKVYQPLWDEPSPTYIPAGTVHRFTGTLARAHVAAFDLLRP